MSPEVIAFGLGVGLLIGLTGIGGGSLMTPLLVTVLGVSPVMAVGTDLTYGAITKTFGGIKHLRQGTVDLDVAKWLGYGGVPGALLGVLALDRLHAAYGASFNHVLIACLAGALLVVAVTLLVRTLVLPRLAAQERETYVFALRSRVAAIGLGLLMGVLLGLTSVGSGALIGVAMIVIFRLTPRRVAGSSVFLAALLLWVAGIAHIISGNVNYSLMGNILLGSLPGVWVGAHFVDRVPASALRVTLAAVLLGSALALVGSAGGNLPPAVIFGAPIAVGVAGFLRRAKLAAAASPGVAHGSPTKPAHGSPAKRLAGAGPVRPSAAVAQEQP